MGQEGAPRSGSFWSSLPGVITGIAGVISAAGGIYALSRQQGPRDETIAHAPVNADVAAPAAAGASQPQAATRNEATGTAPAPAPPPPPPPPPTWPDIAGHWQTSFGPLDFMVSDVRGDGGAVVGKSVRATYISEGETGRLAGELQGSTLEGHWFEPNSARRCANERGGTWFWGRFELEFNRAVNEVQGHWGYCEGALDLTFTGTRD
jgi:hypothetical protein